MHTFKNFKNFADAEIDLSKPMTVLIGRNGSGKSNLIEGVELLAEILKKGTSIFKNTSDIERGGDFQIRGSLNGCARQGHESFEVGFKNKQEQGLFRCNFKVNFKPSFSIESLKNFPDNASASMDIIQPEPKINTREIEYPYTLVSVFDAYPRVMRGYSPIGLNQLSKNGSNLSSVLYYLHQNEPVILENILNNIKQLPEEDIEIFDFITTSDNSDVLVALKYTNGQVISAKLLSDGTLRALAILTALETVPEGSRIIIEEIDNGIHASRVNVLLNAIWEASNRRNLHTLITTHNPATLDELSEEQLDGVVVCHYDKASQSAKLTPFFEIPNVDVLMQKGKLGGLVTRNVIERYLDPDFEKEQEAIALKWLESCK